MSVPPFLAWSMLMKSPDYFTVKLTCERNMSLFFSFRVTFHHSGALLNISFDLIIIKLEYLRSCGQKYIKVFISYNAIIQRLIERKLSNFFINIVFTKCNITYLRIRKIRPNFNKNLIKTSFSMVLDAFKI